MRVEDQDNSRPPPATINNCREDTPSQGEEAGANAAAEEQESMG